MTAADGFGAWLRRQREQRLWSRTELARRIIQSARDHGDTTMPSTGSLTHNLYRWERGANGISDRYRLYCCDILGAQPAQPPAHVPARPAPPEEAASGGTLIVITITVPDGIQARVRIVDPADGSGQNRYRDLNEPRQDTWMPQPRERTADSYGQDTVRSVRSACHDATSPGCCCPGVTAVDAPGSGIENPPTFVGGRGCLRQAAGRLPLSRP